MKGDSEDDDSREGGSSSSAMGDDRVTHKVWMAQTRGAGDVGDGISSGDGTRVKVATREDGGMPCSSNWRRHSGEKTDTDVRMAWSMGGGGPHKGVRGMGVSAVDGDRELAMIVGESDDEGA